VREGEGTRTYKSKRGRGREMRGNSGEDVMVRRREGRGDEGNAQCY
jgi:hypothetical protein